MYVFIEKKGTSNGLLNEFLSQLLCFYGPLTNAPLGFCVLRIYTIKIESIFHKKNGHRLLFLLKWGLKYFYQILPF